MFHLEQEIISINRLKLKCFVEIKKNHHQHAAKLTFMLWKGNVLTASESAVLCLQKEQSTDNNGVHFFFLLVLSKCLRSETKRSSLARRG